MDQMSMKKRANYANGKIYKIVNDLNDMVYVGSTASTLTKRFAGHKLRAKTLNNKFCVAAREIGFDHFRIILIELFPCTCKAELEAREYAVTNAIDKALLYNTRINGKIAPETKVKIAAAHFNRGCIRHFTALGRRGYKFQWMQDGKQESKSFSYPTKRTKQDAYMLCVALRDEIHPLTNRDYLDELPFAN